nr:glycosyltransferase [Nesterenkonia sp. DZ6]
MPIYEPDESTDLAIQSLLRQSWRNLEIIVIDDASPSHDRGGVPTDYRDRLQRWADKDDRVRLVLCEENRGAYAVRNDGYDLAKGLFVTIADKDDWHHPQKIELQATELLNDTSVKANLGNWVRVSEDLEFLVRWGPDRVVHPSFASLMFRREEIQETLGYWDTVRKSGDGEFKFRFQLVYGVDLQPTMKAPLAFSLMGAGNLTSSDLGLGYRHDDRHAYQRAYRDWHRQIERGEVSAYMPKNPATRPFVAPPSFLPQKPTEPPAYDVIYLSEFGFEAGNSSVLLQEITTCLDAGLKVGVIPIENGLIPSASKRHFIPALERLVLDGRVDRLAVEQAAQTKLLLIRWPACMQLALGTRSQLVADRILVVANHMPYELAGDRRSYDVRAVTRNVSATFGAAPEWAAESERLREYIQDLVPSGQLTDGAWKGITVPLDSEARSTRTPSEDRLPVIGRHGRDHPGKWPSKKADFRNVYPIDGSVEVAILGGAGTPIQAGWLPAELPETWTVYPFNGIDVSDYLRSLDFFVYYHSDDLVEAFGMAILEAMNHGVVCVLPPHFEPVFGEGAVYATPRNVQATISELWDPQLYATQRQKAFDFVRAECSPIAYIKRLHALGVDPA